MKVAFLDEVHKILENGLTKLGCDCVDLTAASKSEVENVIHEYDGIVIRSRFSMDKEFLSKATQLKFIARSGAGMENIDSTYCELKGIQLFSAPEGNRNAVGEHALGMLLSLFNKLHIADREVRNGVWDREGNRGVELEGKNVGIIGYGNNGSAFAQKLEGFDVDIYAFDKYKTGFGSKRVKEATIEDIFNHCDVVSLHIPQNSETKWMIDKDFINRMSKPFYLINLSRGRIVKTADLLDAIDEEKVLGGCLDVLEYEKTSFENMFSESKLPTDFERLLACEHVVLSPHVGGWTNESYYKLSKVLLEKVKNFLIN